MPHRRAFEFVQDRTAEVEVLPPRQDYTWPRLVPLANLRRAIEREIKEAAAMAAEAIPAWRGL